ncbi:MAG: glycosyltransferase family 4 protein [Anaerolineales bacterium]|nr:glycosyltransferase family 4 protein [Anaerolineales bacterium]
MTKLRVCIPIEFKAQGGGFYFLRSFEQHLQKMGWLVTSNISANYDVLFTNHWMVSPRQIASALRRRPSLCVVQRIDGAAQDYGRGAESDFIQAQVNVFADLTIFQSEYCRFSTRQKFNVIAQDGPVIHNPVDLEQFSPEGDRRQLAGQMRFAAISWSTNPRKGAASLYEIARQNPQVHIYLCGNYLDAPDLPNLHPMGVLGREELAQILRSCSALLTFSENEACPNHVLEALASGLPVLYIDSGAMSEVVGDAGYPVSVETFPLVLTKLQADHEQLVKRARSRAEQHFDPNRIFNAYMEQIQNAYQRTRRINFARSVRAWNALLSRR